MSKKYQAKIKIPENVNVSLNKNELIVEGPKGKISKKISKDLSLEIKQNEIILSIKGKELTKQKKMIFGTFFSLIRNLIKGVVSGFEKKLEIIGIGYQASVDPNGNLVLKVGYSHPVIINKEDDIEFSVQKNIVSVFGISKEKVGNIAAKIRRVRPPEPYKGKGIRYLGEVVRKKEGKKAISSTT